VTPLGFEVEVDMDLSEKKSSDFVETYHEDKSNDKSKKNEADVNEKSSRDILTPPPMVRSTSSFPFHNRTFTDWCVNKPPKWKRKLKKVANNVRHAFNRTRF